MCFLSACYPANFDPNSQFIFKFMIIRRTQIDYYGHSCPGHSWLRHFFIEHCLLTQFLSWFLYDANQFSFRLIPKSAALKLEHFSASWRLFVQRVQRAFPPKLVLSWYFRFHSPWLDRAASFRFRSPSQSGLWAPSSAAPNSSWLPSPINPSSITLHTIKQ